MGTSNWQQIPFCIDALRRMSPTSVLDIGVGFGRWGMITREFCDVWFTRVMQEDWKVRVEGVEGYEKSIRDYHRSFYNKIHVGDAATLIPTLPGPWTVTIYGDVLEHFTKEKALELLRFSLEHSDYVLVNIPIGEEFEQGEAYGNVYERHLSTWQREEFQAFGLVRGCLFMDFQGRPYGSFVLSLRDPKKLGDQLFSRWAYYRDHPLLAQGGDSETELIEQRAAEMRHELAFIKSSSSYRLGNRLRTNPLIRTLRDLKAGNRGVVSVRPLARANPRAIGTDVWVMSVSSMPGEPGMPWAYVDMRGPWVAEHAPRSAYARAFKSADAGAVMRAQTGPDPELRFMAHQWGGLVEVEFNGRRETIDLYAPRTGELVVYPARTPMAAAPHPTLEAPGAVVETKPERRGPVPFTPAQQEFIARVQKKERHAVAVHCPRWLGVSSSTRILFEDCYPVPETPEVEPSALTDEQLEHHARVLAEAGVERLVFSGGDEVHLRLAQKVKALRPDVAIDLLWHGSYVQIGEDYVWRIIRLWIDAVQAGLVRGIVTVKAGMEDFFRSIGIPSALVLNYVPGEPLAPPRLETDETRLGLWISGPVWRKNALATISALPMIENARLYGAGLEPRARELVEYLKIPVGMMEPRPLPQETLNRAIRQTHLSLYVTFSECCPMLPLESMKLGVPCLTGPNSHLFEDNEYLFERLVVPFPDRADVIARYIRRAVEEREGIMDEYTRYVRGYNEQARESVRQYLEVGPSLERSAVATV